MRRQNGFAAGFWLNVMLITASYLLPVDFLLAEEPAIVRSKQNGSWSANDTWDKGRVPRAGDQVLIREGHRVLYDAESKQVIRLVQIAGTLEFARDRNTQLEVGLVKIIPGDDLSEEGFDCHVHVDPPPPNKPRPALIVGTYESPIPAKYRAVIRLHYIAGMNAESCPAIVCCGGRMDIHGAPLLNTWVKLNQPAVAGAESVWVTQSPEGWKKDDLVIITSTHRRRDGSERSQTEERRLVSLGPTARGPSGGTTPEYSESYEGRLLPAASDKAASKDPDYSSKLAVSPKSRDTDSNGYQLRLNAKLEFDHDGEGNYRGEVANLSRNVVVESADPQGVRGHTMYHVHSQGSISYAEFRHLGKKDKLGRYSIHFHLVEDSMRGSFVNGASIWDSENRWVVIHGTNYLVVRDCVGYKSIGHGYFMEDGTEVFNVLDHNLAVHATAGKALPKQVMPFDMNRGAGFWWANCHNTFSNNVAADCDEYGYRFEVKKTADFSPLLSILQPDGTKKTQDVRTMPFIKFDNNESHAIKFFGMNLRGFSRDNTTKFHDAINAELYQEAREAQPDRRYPFWVHNFRAWETTWGYNAGTAGVFIDGLDIYRSQYGMWRCVLDRNVWRDVTMHEITNKELHMPYSIGPPNGNGATDKEYFTAIQGFVDDFPPHTVVTHVVRNNDEVLVCGSSSDSSVIRRVLVNGRPAYSTRDNFAEWEVLFAVPADKPFSIAAHAEDAVGNVEPRPHQIHVPVLSR